MLAIAIDDPVSPLAASLDGHRVLLRQSDAEPVVIGVPHEDEADALADELRVLSTDACLRDALNALAERFSTIS
jgi:hypothetical protein